MGTYEVHYFLSIAFIELAQGTLLQFWNERFDAWLMHLWKCK
jgi:hypothetical protein